MQERTTRRRYLATVVTAGAAALAGCPSNGESGDSETAADDDATATRVETDTRTTEPPTATESMATATSEPTTTARSPEAIAQAFYRAADDGDFETANALVHDESAEGHISEAEQTVFERQTINVTRTTLDDRTETTANVTVRLQITRDETERTTRTTLELRRSDGQWRLYDSS